MLRQSFGTRDRERGKARLTEENATQVNSRRAAPMGLLLFRCGDRFVPRKFLWRYLPHDNFVQNYFFWLHWNET
jgi:hypothetical protein